MNNPPAGEAEGFLKDMQPDELCCVRVAMNCEKEAS